MDNNTNASLPDQDSEVDQHLEPQFLLSVNHRLVNKNDHNATEAFSIGFKPIAVTATELIKWIQKGYAFSYIFQDETRKVANFLATDVLAVDIDGTLTIDEVITNPFVNENASFLYTTASHTADSARLRVVFFLDHTIENQEDVRAASTALAIRVSGDFAATDPARLFYGSSNAEIHRFDSILKKPVLDELIAQGKEHLLKARTFSPSALFPSIQSSTLLQPNQLLKLRNGQLIALSDIKTKTTIFCPDHFDTHPSAFVGFNQKNNVFLYCHACQKTRWLSRAVDPYNFNSFDDEVRRIYHERQQKSIDIETPFGVVSEIPIQNDRIHLSESRHFSIKTLEKGLTFVKSPKGSGKTTMIFDVLQPLRERVIGGDLSLLFLEENEDIDEKPFYQRSETSFSILLIGHRQALIRELCKRLNLACYLDDEWQQTTSLQSHLTGQKRSVFAERQSRYGVCLDSLPIVEHDSYDLIILDECEQVLAHFLSSTMRARRQSVFRKVSLLLERAKSVIALDADLSWVSFMTLTDLAHARSNDLSVHVKSTKGVLSQDRSDPTIKSKPVTIYLNRFDQPTKRYEIYQSKPTLLAHLAADIKDGVKVFFTSNSKAQVDQLHAKFSHLYPEKSFLKVTSDNSNSTAIQEILLNAKTALLQFDAVFTSPSLSTGIDLTFENDEIVFQRVYGLFQASINTHFDIDQQLARVRHTEVIRCWISNETFRYETDIEICSLDLMKEHLLANTISNVQPVDIEDEQSTAFTRMGSLILSSERQSKNRLLENFIKHKEHHQVQLVYVEKDKDKSKEGSEILKEGKRLSRLNQVQSILTAAALSQREFIDITEAKQQSRSVSIEKLHSYNRHLIEFFNRTTTLTTEMVDRYLDHSHQAVRFYERISDLVDQRKAEDNHLAEAKCAAQKERLKLVETMLLEKSIETRIDQPLDLLAYTVSDILLSTSLFHISVEGEFQPIVDAEISMQDLRVFIEKVQAYKWVFDCFQIPIRFDLKEKPTRMLSDLLKRIDLTLKKSRVSQANNQKVYFYRLEQSSVQLLIETVKRREAIDHDPYIVQYWSKVHEENNINETIFQLVYDMESTRYVKQMWVPVFEETETTFKARKEGK